MKTPEQLAAQLARQWQNADLREQRLLEPGSWPLRLPIGKPNGQDIRNNIGKVRQHHKQWRDITVGRVEWQPMRSRSVSDEIMVPTSWLLSSPSEWIQATGDRDIQREYRILSRLAASMDKRFHCLIIRRRRLVLDKTSEEEVIRCAELALQLKAGQANGKPLRALSVAGIDSKFFARNRQLITQLLDVLFNGQVSDLGLEAFLDAENEGQHWLLVADLDGQLLPFSQIRVRASELEHTPLPGQRLLMIENERCLHQLPQIPGTIGVLGSGLNLSWLRANWIGEKSIAYWGDLDTWGLTMLARARHHQPELTPLLMTQRVFSQFQADKAVTESQPATPTPPDNLTQAEISLYLTLLACKRGRLEQEFLPSELVHQEISEWLKLIRNAP